MFSREHYWVQGGLQQYYSSPSCLCCQVHAVPAKVPSTGAGSHSGWLAEQCWAPEGKFKSSELLSGGRCSLLCGTSLRVTNSKYLFFWWTEASESACSDGSKEKPGISKTYSRRGNFSLALSTGQCAKTIKASERAWFPHKFASPENKKSCLSPREVQETNSCQVQPTQVHICHLCPGEWDFAKESPLSSHL